MLPIDERRFMAQAIALAEKGRYTARPNPLVGCVIVKEGQIIAEGAHLKYGYAHAEQQALSTALESTQGATCYVTLEPCAHQGQTPPCTHALIAAGIARVVIAISDPNPLVNGKGIAQLREAGIQVEIGVLAEQAAALNPGFMMKQKHGRPYVRAKLALSLDGRTAMASGESQWITGSAARERVQALRAMSGAIVTGSNTVLKDNPRLTVRSENILSKIPAGHAFQPPMRVVLDRRAQIKTDAAIFSSHAPTWHVTGEQTLQDLVVALAKESVNDVLVEAGPTLVGAFLSADLINEMVLFYAPKLLGHQGMPLAFLPNQLNLADHIGFQVKSVETVGEDICVTVVKKA